MAKVQVGVIGTGKHGSRYVNHILNDVTGLQLVATCRRSEVGKAQAAEWGTTYYSDWLDLVQDERVEAVLAITPPAVNLAIAQACVKLKKPLLLEKPLGIDSRIAGEIVDLFAMNEVPLTVGQTLRYNSVVAGLKNRIQDIGPLYGFSANQRLEPSTLAWHEDAEAAGAGVTFHTAVHVFDALRFITGLEVKRVMAQATRHHNSNLEDLVTVMVEMENGVLGTIDCSKVGQARSGRFEFVGRDGQLHGDQVHDVLELLRDTDIRVVNHAPPGNTIIPLLLEWFLCLIHRGENPIPGEEGLAAVRICEACLASARSRQWVDVVQLYPERE